MRLKNPTELVFFNHDFRRNQKVHQTATLTIKLTFHFKRIVDLCAGVYCRHQIAIN